MKKTTVSRQVEETEDLDRVMQKKLAVLPSQFHFQKIVVEDAMRAIAAGAMETARLHMATYMATCRLLEELPLGPIPERRLWA